MSRKGVQFNLLDFQDQREVLFNDFTSVSLNFPFIFLGR
jgi:hypothetical protein